MANEEALRDYLKWVTTNLHETREHLREVEERRHEPLAIVGMSCRLPGGVHDPEGLWELVASGTDAVAALPTDRGWDLVEELYGLEPDPEGRRQGGFVHDATEFDAGFFGISPREAQAMDPQQRLLLEVSWEALERAGLDPRTLRGSRTGVYAGASFSGYGLALAILSGGDGGSDGFGLTGQAGSAISGRVSYVLGLEGPAVTIDTACSSSLVALHLACQAVRDGECDMALAGGVAVMADPGAYAEFGKQGGMAADGRCKSFADSADGIGWAEGAGIVVVERLSDARRHGHRVLALVAGSAVNQDGASNGLTAPNGPAQQRVIRAALANARLGADQVDAVEAHGTGTTLGDPIEAQALLATYGQGRPEDSPLWLGSVKSNIGHAQAAAGVTGVIKMVQALRHAALPGTLHVDEPSSHVDWSAGSVSLLSGLAEPMPWPETDHPKRAGVSAFGVSGTNAHVILEEAPAPGSDDDEGSDDDGVGSGESSGEGSGAPEAHAVEAAAADGGGRPERSPEVLGGAGGPAATVAWPVSGRTSAALLAQAARLRAFALERPDVAAADVAWSLATTRSAFEHRAVVTGTGHGELLAGLAAVAAGEPAADVVSGELPGTDPGRVVFVFPGQGSQWVGMGAELAGVSPVFGARLAECETALAPFVDWSLREVLAGGSGAPGFNRVDVVQPALWAVMVSLAAVWEAAGVAPDAVVGHSQGEIAAAVVAGVLSLEDGARVVALRSQALRGLAGRGGMLSIAAGEAAVRDRIASYGERVSVAALNGPAATVVSGEPVALEELAAACEADGVRARVLPVDYASHSPQVEELEAGIRSALAGVAPRVGRVPVVSSLTGGVIDGSAMDAGYWYDSLRATVRFSDAVTALAGEGHSVFVETSPHPVLTAAVTDTVEAAVPEGDGPGEGGGPVVTGTLRRDEGGAARLLASFAEAYVRGVAVDWSAVLPAGERVDLPTYAFQRQRYWPKGALEGGALAGARARDATGSWWYRESWVPVSGSGRASLTGTWLVVTTGAGPQEPVGACTRALAAAGAEVAVVETGTGDVTRAQLARLVAESAGREVAGVVSLLALDEEPRKDLPLVSRGLAGSLALVQALGDAGIGAPLWMVTSGAVAPAGTGAARHLVQAQTWGLGRVAGLEHPDRWGGLIDLPQEWDEAAAERFAFALAGSGEDELAIRPSGVLARRLVRASPPRRPERPWTPSGTVLVTGASGAIGPHLAHWLAGRGAPRLVLTTRRGANVAGMGALAAGLAEAGSDVGVLACDVSRRDQVAGLLERIGSGGPRLSAVVHAAVAGDLMSLEATGTEDLAVALGGKVAGARWLDELTADAGLDAFVLFSSIAATWGSSEHAAYAAANAHLDVLAGHRRARGLPATTVAWGVWDAGEWVGQDAGLPSSISPARLRRQGMRFLDPALALDALDRAIGAREPFVAVADVDWARFVPVFTAARRWRLLDVLADEVARQDRAGTSADADGPADQAGPSGLAGLVAGLDAAGRERAVVELVRSHAAAVLGHENASEVGAGRAFRDLGFDSLTAVELRTRINGATGLRLPSTVVFDYPSPRILARHVLSFLPGGGEQGAVSGADAPAAGRPDDDPVVVTGMGCRLPGGVTSPDLLWDLLAAGGDATGEFPADRGWDLDRLLGSGPDRAGTSSVSRGGFVTGVADFDPGFFGISPREALTMDPQQRLLLEVSWEALERAGIDPTTLRGRSVGVFAGATASGYAGAVGQEGAEGHLVTGNALSVISGRVSYVLGLEGPAVTLDTACSSSLVALHLAAQAVRAGECSMALAGGVTVITSPEEFVGFTQQGALAADGRCKAFAEGADGMALAEGAGMVVVERLSDARRAGRTVLAVVAGSAVNQDGASNGLTAPNGPSQQRVIRAALAGAGLSAGQVDVVEAHGTGTELGDPIEAQALLATYGRQRTPERPLWLGSVKSNIGHAQQAAGIAGVIKAVLALTHQVVPATLHADEPSTHVDWEDGQVRLATEPVAWPAVPGGEPRRAGVSAFGISGTNAHVILQEPPTASGPDDTGTGAPLPYREGAADGGRDSGDTRVATDRGAGRTAQDRPGPAEPVLAPDVELSAWTISARTGQALAGQAGRLREHLAARPEPAPADVAWSLATTRSLFEHRAVVTAAGRRDLLAALASVAVGEPAAGVVAGAAPVDGDPGRVVFVFPGHGSQWAGMGRELAAASPLFAARLAECGRALAPHTTWTLDDLTAGRVDLEREDVLQPVLWAVTVSLAALWQAAGVVPDAVLGHSQGEIAAATVAGILSLDDAALLVARRSRALTALSGRGGMLSIAEPEQDVLARLEPYAGRVGVSVVNSPAATVVSGDLDALTALEAACAADAVRTQRVPIDYASHSAAVEPVADRLLADLAPLTPAAGDIPMISATTAEPVDGTTLDAAYWYASLRAPVRFADAVTALAATGHGVYVEVSPHPVLVGAISSTVEDTAGGPAPVVTGTLRRDAGGPARLLASLAAAHVRGVPVDWTAVLPAGRRVELPTYAFQRQAFWPEPAPDRSTVAAPGTGSPAETAFWAAVEDGDPHALAAALHLDTGGAVDADRPLREALPALAAWRRRERSQALTAGWRYRVAWTVVPETAPGSGPAPSQLNGRWLAVVPAGHGGSELVRRCVAALAVHGAEIEAVEVPVSEVDRSALATRLGAIARGPASAGEFGGSGSGTEEGPRVAAPVAGVVSFLALDGQPTAHHPAVTRGLATSQTLVQALGDADVTAPLWLVTSGAVATHPHTTGPHTTGPAHQPDPARTTRLDTDLDADPAIDPVQAQLWGLGRVVALEHPDRWGGLVDLPAEPDDLTGARLAAVLATGTEDQVAIRPTATLARRVTAAGPSRAARPWRPDGTVLITGGTGGIGAQVARWAAGRGPADLVLTSRSGPAADGAADLAAGLAQDGTSVQVLACDIARRSQATGLLDRIALDGTPLRAVLHAAGTGQSTALDDTTVDELADVLAAKVAGAAHLDDLTRTLDLDRFVLFSSISATWGSGRQPGYAAANAYLDALTEQRRSRGQAAQCVAWGLWDGAGMGAHDSRDWLERSGLRPMAPELAVAALAQAIDGDEGPITVADVDWNRFAPAFTLRRPSPLLGDLPQVRQALTADPAAPGTGAAIQQAAAELAARLTRLNPADQDRTLADLVRAEAAAVLGHPGPEAVHPGRPFRDLGIDSLTAVELRDRLGAATGLRLPSTLVFDHPTAADIATLLRRELTGAGTEDASALAELERLESALRSGPRDGAERSAVVERLEELLLDLRAGDEDDPTAAGEDLDLASDDEMFELVEKELGAPESD
ncbi:putative modular polyketide synthase [Actinacidiphila reveromycinica]|uniref:Putative modular polyketide synthase n=1 Tax=Actinacidiphila reveromycinica TaxID=659352 RepID=A0A7U3VSS4_9ACTN|nr:type I polyketide synthase [Streptomyces sp. SN-593]BBB02253.1 putative modular polyketide synthase [Streptomyces sp. SN-593]